MTYSWVKTDFNGKILKSYQKVVFVFVSEICTLHPAGLFYKL